MMPDFAALTLDQLADFAVRWGSNGMWAALILVGGWVLAGWAERAVSGGLSRVRVCDSMLRGFFSSIAKWAILVFTGIAVLERVGVQTTSVVAILGAAGLAVGLALQGTLSNLAAGVMLLLFRPFKIGDSIESGAAAGKVTDLSLFHTGLVTADNVQVIVPNAMLWNAALRNFSTHPVRRIEVVVPVPYGADVEAAMVALRRLVEGDGRIAMDPAPSVVVAKLGEKAADVSVTAWCESGQLGTVKADLNAAAWRVCLKGVPV